MAAVAAVPPQETYKHYTDAILSYRKPKDAACPKILIAPRNVPQSSNQFTSKEVSQAVEFAPSMMQKMPK